MRLLQLERRRITCMTFPRNSYRVTAILITFAEERGNGFTFVGLLPAGSARRAALPVFRLLDHGPILGFFAPKGRHVAPIKVKFGSEERTIGSLLPAKFDLDRFRGGGLRPPKLKKIRILPI